MNYYEILKVSKNASQQEIRDSYKKLIKKYHPDLYKGNSEYAEKITKELNDTYAILSNEERKKEYDAIINPPTSNIYKPTSYKQNYTNMEYEEPIKPSLEDMMKSKIYNIVDEKTSKMNRQSKTFLVILVILFALLLTALSIHDYINIVKLSNKSNDLQNNTTTENIINSKSIQ